MGQWGVRSYENDEAADALDAGFDRVHAARYEELMDDRNPMDFDQVQAVLASPDTLAAAVDALKESVGLDVSLDDWDDLSRLAFAGVVVRHAEQGVPVPPEWLDLATGWLEAESFEWDESTLRRLRREAEVRMLRKLGAGS
jgi:hypothetical protein